MSRHRTLILSVLSALALVALFMSFIAFRDDAALISALSAAGTVAAAGFAAAAALGSMRAAAESGAAARRSHEVLARSSRPNLYPRLEQRDGHWFGVLHCGAGHAAIDVAAVWVPADGHTVIERVARLGPSETLAAALDRPVDVEASKLLKMVWIDYWDEKRNGHWRDSWTPESGAFVQTDSQLAG